MHACPIMGSMRATRWAGLRPSHGSRARYSTGHMEGRRLHSARMIPSICSIVGPLCTTNVTTAFVNSPLTSSTLASRTSTDPVVCFMDESILVAQDELRPRQSLLLAKSLPYPFDIAWAWAGQQEHKDGKYVVSFPLLYIEYSSNHCFSIPPTNHFCRAVDSSFI